MLDYNIRPDYDIGTYPCVKLDGAKIQNDNIFSQTDAVIQASARAYVVDEPVALLPWLS